MTSNAAAPSAAARSLAARSLAKEKRPWPTAPYYNENDSQFKVRGRYSENVINDLHAVVAARLRSVGQRYTTGRALLIDALAEAERPFTAAELVAAEPRLSQSTTYRNLSVLEQAAVVRTVTGTDEYTRFELDEDLTGRHHHHLVCLSCGTVEDFDAPRRVEQGLADAIARLSSGTGFRPEGHRLDVLGTCAACAGRRRAG
jgi:Fur family transcriptional regulator, ferric uptake regulator